jgi:PTH1 family peptidyl-tRNA hydrolase
VFLLVGLGNPGQKYARTRHNVGFDVVDRLGERWGIAVTRSSSQSLVGDGLVKNERAVLMKPQTYVNLSGGPVRAAMDFYKVPIGNVVVVHDELEVPFGRVRVKRGGGHGGHNGIRDLNQHLGTDYPRVRVGTGRPPEGWDPADFVLSRWKDDEGQEVLRMIERACDAMECVVTEGVDAAMNRFNGEAPTKGEGKDEDE